MTDPRIYRVLDPFPATEEGYDDSEYWDPCPDDFGFWQFDPDTGTYVPAASIDQTCD